MKRTLWLSTLLASASFLAAPAYAIQISYDLASLGGNQYRYTYTVTNDGSTGGAVELFDILFNPAIYDELSLAIVTADPPASAWSEQFIASGILIPAAYDALALSGGIPISSSETGFAVEFAWLGVGTPGSQGFEIYDPTTFDLLETGATTATVVPIPAALPLISTALLSLVGFRHRRRG